MGREPEETRHDGAVLARSAVACAATCSESSAWELLKKEKQRDLHTHEMMSGLRSVVVLVGLLGGALGGSLSQRARHNAPSPAQRLCALRGGAAEHTYAMLKPDIASNDATVTAVKAMIEGAGLNIEREERCKLSRRECEVFYEEHKERPFFRDLVKFMSSGPVVKLEVSGPNAIKKWRELIGPTNSLKARDEAPGSVRALFGTDGQRNAAHGSDAPESATRELQLMFK